MSHGGGFEPRRLVIGQFADSDAMLDATRKMRERGHKKLDTHTPYPVHGIEEALGLDLWPTSSAGIACGSEK